MITATLIAAKGQMVTLDWTEQAAYDPANGTVTSTPVTVVTDGVVLPLSRGLRYMSGSDITVDDQQLLLPGGVAQPPVGAVATIGGKKFSVIEVAPLAPAGEAEIYDCIIRGVP